MTAFVPYVTFMKHAKKVAKSQVAKTRPILSTVIHRDNYVAVTDSHRLYKATGLYEGVEKQVDPNTGMDVNNGNYPEIERLIQDGSDVKYSYEVDVIKAYEVVRAIEIASKINKATSFMNIVTGDNMLAFKTDEKAAFGVIYSAEESASVVELETMTLDIKYVKEALHVLKDAKAETFTLEYFGKTRPLQFKAGNFTAIVLPIRTTH